MRRFALVLACVLSFAVHAQEWPVKPVRIIVPFPAGGSADLMPRAVAEKLAQMWGQPVIVDNRPGAAGNIGAEAVFRADADGYTLMSSPPPPLVINKLLYPKLAYDPDEFVPISVIGAIPNVLLVHPKVPAASVAELSAEIRPGSRVVMDAHNCYPYDGRWADRIQRALSAGAPLAIEQDLRSIRRPAAVFPVGETMFRPAVDRHGRDQRIERRH